MRQNAPHPLTPEATLIERDMGWRVYAVSWRSRSYQVRHHFVTDRWIVTNPSGTPIHADGALGRRLVTACKQAFAVREVA